VDVPPRCMGQPRLAHVSVARRLERQRHHVQLLLAARGRQRHHAQHLPWCLQLHLDVCHGCVKQLCSPGSSVAGAPCCVLWTRVVGCVLWTRVVGSRWRRRRRSLAWIFYHLSA
jgi:hypothetical protein